MLRDSFLPFLFGNKAQSDKSSRRDSGRRSLNLEALEDRHMLSVSFDSPIVNDYVASSSGAVNPSLVEHRLLFSGDFNNDGKADILAVENSRAYTYLNSGSKQNAFPDSGLLATNGLLTIMKADVGKVTGGTSLDLLGVSVTDNTFNFSVYGGRGNGGFYNLPTVESNWTGLSNLLTSRGVTVPPAGSLYSALGNIFLVENNGSLDLICTVAYYVARADSSLYEFGTINLLFANNGKGEFVTAPNVISTGNTGMIAAGDLTGNGRPDYVTRNDQNADKLDIYLNNGTKITTDALGKEIGEVVVAKCHTGNRMEIIAAVKDANGNNSLCVLTVNGTTVSKSALYSVDIVPINIVAGDFDNDGMIDIFISDGSIHQALLGQSNGTFKTEKAVVANADFMAVYSADFTGDGTIDVLAVGKRFAWLIPGDSSKSPSVVVDFATYNLTPKDIAFGDFNGNGKIDFAVLNHAGNEVHVFNQSSTTVSTPLFTKAATPLSASFGKQLLVGNFDNAHGDDIVIYGVDETGIASPVLQTYLSTTSGFSAVKTTPLPDTYDLLTVGDATNNGYLDIVAIWNGNIGTRTAQVSYYQVLENNSANPGSFTAKPRVTFGTQSTYVTAAAIGDMNGDNRNDLVLLDAAGKSVLILPQSPSPGVFWTNANMKSYLVTGLSVDNAAFSQLAIADFNLNGVNDVLVGMWTTSGDLTFRVLENDPANKGTFKSDTNITYMQNDFIGTNASGLALHVGLLDDNGTPDLVFVGGNTVKRFHNTDKSGSEIGTVMLVFRDYNSNNELTYIDEWSTFYVEIWGNTGTSAAGIKNFETVITFDTRFFEVRFDEIAWGTNISGNFTKGTGQITLNGTVSGTQGNNTNVLLGYVAFRPSSDTRSIALDFSNGPKPMENGFAVQKNTITSTTNVTGQSKYVMPKQIPLFPVIYDNNGDGRIDAQDYTRFLQVYGMNVSSNSAEQYIHFCNYIISTQTISAQDYTLLLQNYGLTKKAFRDDPRNPANRLDFHSSFLGQTLPAVSPVAPAAAPAMMASFAGEVFEELFDGSSFLEPLAASTLPEQNTQNQALMAFIDSQETKKDVFDIESLNPASETARLLAEGKL